MKTQDAMKVVELLQILQKFDKQIEYMQGLLKDGIPNERTTLTLSTMSGYLPGRSAIEFTKKDGNVWHYAIGYMEGCVEVWRDDVIAKLKELGVNVEKDSGNNEQGSVGGEQPVAG